MKNDYDTDLDVMFCRSYGSADDPVSCVESDGKEKQGTAFPISWYKGVGICV